MRSAIAMLIGAVLLVVASPAAAAESSEMAAGVVPEHLAARSLPSIPSLLPAGPVQLPRPAPDRREARQTLRVPLYATLGLVQVWDVCSTRSAVGRTARETNPVMASGSMPQLIAAKAATSVATVYFVERLRKQHRTAAVIILAAINGGTAAVAMLNQRNGRPRAR